MSAEDLHAATQAVWDGAAATFDNEPDHGLRNEITREAWSQLLQRLLPPPPAVVLDAGCGTGSLSTLLASLGYQVTGIDVSPAMLAIARDKALSAGLQVDFLMQNAATPKIPGRDFSVVLCRHVLWTLPDPNDVLRRWSELLRPGGRMVLVEGFWHTGAGLRPQAIVDAMPQTMFEIRAERLSDVAALWGGSVSDERFVVTATKTGLEQNY